MFYSLYDDICADPYKIEQKIVPIDGMPLVHNMAKILLIDYLNSSVSHKEGK